MTAGFPHNDSPTAGPSPPGPFEQAPPDSPNVFYPYRPPRPGEVDPLLADAAELDAQRSKNLAAITPTSAGYKAIRLPHILWAVVTACDFPTVQSLSLTSKWVREIVNTASNNPTERYWHLFVHAHRIGRRYRHVWNEEMWNKAVVLDSHSFLQRDIVDGELSHTTIDYLGPARHCAKEAVGDLIPNCVRLQWCGCVFDLGTGDTSLASSIGEVDYPIWVSRARCLVAFPYHVPLVKPDDIEVYGDSPWVFDRVVYHPCRTTDHDGTMSHADDGPAIPNVEFAWHSVFLLPVFKWSGSTCYDKILDRIAQVSALALQKRATLIPDAHVTIVSNVDTVLPNMPQGPVGKHDRPRFHEASLEVVFRDAVAAYLADPTLQSDPNHENDTEFIADAVAAIKFKSWAQYEASSTPRQWEVENIQ